MRAFITFVLPNIMRLLLLLVVLSSSWIIPTVARDGNGIDVISDVNGGSTLNVEDFKRGSDSSLESYSSSEVGGETGKLQNDLPSLYIHDMPTKSGETSTINAEYESRKVTDAQSMRKSMLQSLDDGQRNAESTLDDSFAEVESSNSAEATVTVQDDVNIEGVEDNGFNPMGLQRWTDG